MRSPPDGLATPAHRRCNTSSETFRRGDRPGYPLSAVCANDNDLRHPVMETIFNRLGGPTRRFSVASSGSVNLKTAPQISCRFGSIVAVASQLLVQVDAHRPHRSGRVSPP